MIKGTILSFDSLNPSHWPLRLCQQIAPTTIQNPGSLLLWYVKSDHGFLYIKNAWSSRHVHCSSAYTILSSNFDFLDLFQATSVTSWPIFYVESSHGIKHFEIIMFFIFLGCRNFVLSLWWASTNGTGPKDQNELNGIGMNWMHACMHAYIFLSIHTCIAFTFTFTLQTWIEVHWIGLNSKWIIKIKNHEKIKLSYYFALKF